MRNLFGIPQDLLLVGVVVLALTLAGGLVVVALRNPLLPRLALRNVPRRPGFAILTALSLTLGTVILSTAFTTGDTMSLAVRTIVAGALGSADEVVFLPDARRRSVADVAQSVANGTLLTGLAAYIPESAVDRVRTALDGEERVAGVLPAILEQTPIAAPGNSFRAVINLLGVPPDLAPGFAEPHTPEGIPLPLADLGPDEVYANTEVAAALGIGPGDTLRILGQTRETEVRVRAIARVGDLGGGQATLFLPLAHLQALTGHEGEINQVLVANHGSPADRLVAAWPVTVRLRSAFLDEATAARLFRVFSSPAARQGIEAAAERTTDPRTAERLRQLRAALEAPEPTPEFAALVQDPELLGRLGSSVPGISRNQDRGPFAASLAGGASTLRVLDVQRLAQDQADRWSTAFTDLFVVLGLFSLFSGLLLIVLVFSLLALERRAELGIMRALGGRRRDVILLLALEGGIHSLVSAFIGAVAGVLVALGLIALTNQFIADYGFHLDPTVDPASLAISYGLGALISFGTLTLTAWRTSRFSVVTAIRDLPDPPPGPPSARAFGIAAAPLAAGIALIATGLHQTWSVVYAAGITLALVGLALVARWTLRRAGRAGPERLVFTLAGLALIGWWNVPPAWLQAVHLPVFRPVVEMGFLAGVAMLLGAVWVLAFNVGLLRHLRGRLALWRLSTAYVAANRFRTGITLAMFGLVVLSLTLAAILLTATDRAFNDPETASGGWTIRAESSQPPRDLAPELAAAGLVPESTFAARGATAPVVADVVQPDVDGAVWRSASVLVLDRDFTASTPTHLTAAPAGERATWHTLAERPGTAVVGAGLLNGTSPTAPRLAGGEGAAFQPFVLWLRDTRGGPQPAVRVEVVGVVDGRGPFGNAILVGAGTLAAWPTPDRATYYFTTAPGRGAREVATGLGLTAPDLQAQPIAEQLRLIQGVRGLLTLILQGFMGIGLLAGVAALGTLSTRAVVERRRQIGALRALGFSARAVGLMLLAESAVVAALGSVLGVSVGLVVARTTLVFLSRQAPELRFTIPWEQLAAIVLVALAASLLMTVLPARQAARLSPAAALREG